MQSKKDYVTKLWSHKSPSEIVLVMYNLIENSKWGKQEKDRTYAVMKGIIAYLDMGDDLLSHHRDYLHSKWKLAWEEQKNNSVKTEIKEWLLDHSD